MMEPVKWKASSKGICEQRLTIPVETFLYVNGGLRLPNEIQNGKCSLGQ